MSSRFVRLVRPASLAAAVAVAAASPAVAQSNDADAAAGLPPIDSLLPSNDPWSFSAAYTWQDDEPVTRGGSLGIQRANTRLGYRTQIDQDTTLDLGLNYRFDGYDFSDTTVFDDTWGDVHSLSLTARFQWTVADEWTVFAGPIFEYSGESGAAFSDSITGGGYIGATYQAGNDLLLGFGVGAIGELEDDVRFIPIIVIDWDIIEGWKLSSRTSAATTGDTAIELIWDVSENWDVAAGVSLFGKRRFRLDNDGAVPGGVGEEETRALTFRGTYTVSDAVDLSVFGGLKFESDIELEDNSGQRVDKEDHDEALFLGVSLSVRF
ncbi:MAG: hypothetical protein AB8G96_03430 [Phycisphaerales bacterium]